MARDAFLDSLRDDLLRLGLSHEKIAEFVGAIRQDWGGREVYITRKDRSIRANRIAEAIAFGGSMREIARRAGVAPVTVWRFLRKSAISAPAARGDGPT